MAEKDIVRESLDALEGFEGNNPKIFQPNGTVRFAARVTWEIGNEEPYIENDVYAGWNRDGSGRITLEQPDGFGDWEVFWRFYADVSHYYMYDPTANALRLLDNRRYMEITIEPDISVVDFLGIRDNVN
jgi:hypothetical protein